MPVRHGTRGGLVCAGLGVLYLLVWLAIGWTMQAAGVGFWGWR